MQKESCTSDMQRVERSVQSETSDDKVEDLGAVNSAVKVTPVGNPAQIKVSADPYNFAKVFDDIDDTVGAKIKSVSSKALPGADKEDLKPPSESQKHQLRKKTYLNLDTTSSHFKTSIFDEEDRTSNSSHDPDKSAAKMYKCITSPPLPFSPPSTPPFPFSPPSISSPVSGVAFSAKSYRNDSEKINVLKAFEIALALSYEDDESMQNEEFSKEALLDGNQFDTTADPDAHLLNTISLDATADHDSQIDDANEYSVTKSDYRKISEDDMISLKSCSIIGELNENKDVLLEADLSSMELFQPGEEIAASESLPEHVKEGEVSDMELKIEATEEISKFETEVASIGAENLIEGSPLIESAMISEEGNCSKKIIQDNDDNLRLPGAKTDDISSLCESRRNVENVSCALPEAAAEENAKMQENIDVPEMFVSKFSFSSKSPFGYSKSVIWTAADTDSVSPRIRKSRSSYLGGGACGLAAAKLRGAGYQEHVGMWRGWPYDNWTCCDSRSMICPAAITTSSTFISSSRIENKGSADDRTNRALSPRPHRCDLPGYAVRGASDSIRSWSASNSQSHSVRLSSRSSSASALPRRSQSLSSELRQKDVPMSISSSSTVEKEKVINPAAASASFRKSSKVIKESSSTVIRGDASRPMLTNRVETSTTANFRAKKLSKSLPADFVASSISSKNQTTRGHLPSNQNIRRNSYSIKSSSKTHQYISLHGDTAPLSGTEKEVRKCT